jgi:hypothetical protein
MIAVSRCEAVPEKKRERLPSCQFIALSRPVCGAIARVITPSAQTLSIAWPNYNLVELHFLGPGVHANVQDPLIKFEMTNYRTPTPTQRQLPR